MIISRMSCGRGWEATMRLSLYAHAYRPLVRGTIACELAASRFSEELLRPRERGLWKEGLLLKVARGRGTGTWDVGRGTWGRGDAGTRRRGDAGTRGRGDAGTWGLGDVGTRGREDFGTRRRAGIRGRDKEITLDFCTEFVKFFFEGQM